MAVQDVNWLGIDKYIKEHLAKSLIQDIFNIHPKKQNFNITLRDVFRAVLVDVPLQHFVEVWNSAFEFAN